MQNISPERWFHDRELHTKHFEELYACDQVICWSVRVNCLQIEKTLNTWMNTALQCTVKHTQFFEICGN